ncbi:MAG: 30S ribosome-binding factor RbfA [Acidobacteria bacterium]|nr:30S ribosome-binding factor RbfA [Acidobacteriota bacterium]
MSGARRDRVAANLHHSLTALLQSGMNDPRLGFITVTGVELSKDLGHAEVFVSILGDDEARTRSMEGLASAAGYLRRELAHSLNLRRTPDLRFHLDLSGDQGQRINRLLQDAGLGSGRGETGATSSEPCNPDPDCQGES